MDYDPRKLECPVCKQHYEMSGEHQPHLGACGHSVCKECRPKLLNSLQCPSCLESESFAKEQPNYMVIKILGNIEEANQQMIVLNEALEYFSNENNFNQDAMNSSIFVRNIPHTWTEADVRKNFEEFGNIKNISFGDYNNRNKGMVSVEYSSPQDANSAVKKMNGRNIGWSTIRVALKKNFKKPDRTQALANVAAIRNEQILKKLVVHVKGLPIVTEKDLYAFFGPDGLIREVEIIKDNLGDQSGEARIRFEHSDSVEKALQRALTRFGESGPKIDVTRISS